MKAHSSSRTWINSYFHVSRELLVQSTWTTFGYGATQVIRLASTIILTRLLAPNLFGVMVLLTSLRVGIELFTDLGIGQSVIASKRTREEVFYNTAWTLQVIRGFSLAILSFLALPIIKSFYHDEILQSVLPALGIFLILTGTHSIGSTIATKELLTKRIALYELFCSISQTIITVTSVIISPTVYGLIVGQILSNFFATLATYFIIPSIKPRFVLNKQCIVELVSFGKWIFLSSIVFFLSGYLDRLLLGKYATLAMLGIYGVARALGDTVAQFGIRISNAIIFPKVASAEVRQWDLRNRIFKRRLQFMAFIASGIFALGFLSQPIVSLLYDSRYLSAAYLLPWIALATWLNVLNTLSDSFALGVSKPRIGLAGNALKFFVLALTLPFFITKFGAAGAAVSYLIAESARYVGLNYGLQKEKLTFFRYDIAMTGIILIFIVAFNRISIILFPSVFSFKIFSYN